MTVHQHRSPPDSQNLCGSMYVQHGHQHVRKHYKMAAQCQKKNYDIKASENFYGFLVRKWTISDCQ